MTTRKPFNVFAVDPLTGKVHQGARGGAGEEDLLLWIKEVSQLPHLITMQRCHIVERWGQIAWS